MIEASWKPIIEIQAIGLSLDVPPPPPIPTSKKRELTPNMRKIFWEESRHCSFLDILK